MTRKFVYLLTSFLFFTIFFIGCQEEEYEVKYSVISGIEGFSAKITFKDAKKSEQTLQDAILPWDYVFNGHGGDSIKISAKVFDGGNISIIGTDTLKVIIFINGQKYKENSGIIINSNSDLITVSGIIN